MYIDNHREEARVVEANTIKEAFDDYIENDLSYTDLEDLEGDAVWIFPLDKTTASYKHLITTTKPRASLMKFPYMSA